MALHFYVAQRTQRSSNAVETVMENAIRMGSSLRSLSDVEKLIMQVPLVLGRLPRGLDELVYYIHPSWKHHGYGMAPGSAILYEFDSHVHVGLVEVLIEVVGLYLVVCAQYSADLVTVGLYKALPHQESREREVLEMHTNRVVPVHRHVIGKICYIVPFK